MVKLFFIMLGRMLKVGGSVGGKISGKKLV